MSNDKTEVIPTVAPVAPVAPVPTRRSILRAPAAGVPAAQPERDPFTDWRGQAQTEELPAVPAPSRRTGARRTGARRHLARHLKSALAGLLIAAALLTGLQLYAAQGISSARQAALAARNTQPELGAQMSGQTATQSPASSTAMSGQSPSRPEWVTEGTGAPYDRTNPTASPLSLPRCTTSPNTPLPCLATISPDSRRAVVLEEDASLTALTRQ